MKKSKKFSLKLLYPHPIITIFLTILSAAGLVYIFSQKKEESVLAYFFYVVSFYTLCVVIARVIPAIKRVKTALNSNKHTSKYLSEADLRARISIHTGTVINISFAIFKFLAGIYYNSTFFLAIGVYYAVLSIIRFTLIHRDRKTNKLSENQIFMQWKTYRLCGILLMLLNLTMTGMVFQIIWQNKFFSYPGFVIYIIAAYTFYRLIITIIRLIKNKQPNPILLGARAVDLSISLMSLFSLQTAMFNSFSSDASKDMQRLMNIFTGGAVCLGVVLISIFMIIKATKKIKTNTEAQNV